MAVTHISVAPEVGVSHLHAIVGIPVSDAVIVHDPTFERIDVEVEVITENAVLIDLSVGAIEVALLLVGLSGIVGVGVFVDVEHIVGAEEVLDSFKLL